MTPTLTRLALAATLAAAAAPSLATLVTFDDLTVRNPPSSWWDVHADPIDPQAYASLGVVIESGWLWGAEGPYSQTMRASHDTRITFHTASLPTHVSLHVRWLPEDMLDIRATGPGGYSTVFHSWGYENGPSPPPGYGNQTIRFESPGGIASLSFADSGFPRFGPWVDNLYFGHVPGVPEPAPIVLAGVGLLMLWGRWRSSRRG